MKYNIPPNVKYFIIDFLKESAEKNNKVPSDKMTEFRKEVSKLITSSSKEEVEEIIRQVEHENGLNPHLPPNKSKNIENLQNKALKEDRLITKPILELISNETNEKLEKVSFKNLSLKKEYPTTAKVRNIGGGLLDLYISSDVPWLNTSKNHIDQFDLVYDLKIIVNTNPQYFERGDNRNGTLTFSYNEGKDIVRIPVSVKIEGYEKTIRFKSLLATFIALILVYFTHNILWRLFISITPPSIIYGINFLMTFFLYAISILLTYRISEGYFKKYPTQKLPIILLPLLILTTTFFVNVGIEKIRDTEVLVRTYKEMNKVGYINVKKTVNIRAHDSTNAMILTKLKKNEMVKVIGQMSESKWYYIGYGKDFTSLGYIAPEFIKLDTVSIK